MKNTEQPMLYFWHGFTTDDVHRKKHRHSHPSRFYLTNNLITAQEYSSTGSVALFGISPHARLMNQIYLPLDTIYQGLDLLQTERNKHLFSLMHSMVKERFLEQDVPLSFVLDELVNSAVLVGEEGDQFSKWLRSQHVDAFLKRTTETDNHLLVFNPDIVVVQKTFPIETAQQIGNFATYDKQYSDILLALEQANDKHSAQPLSQRLLRRSQSTQTKNAVLKKPCNNMSFS